MYYNGGQQIFMLMKDVICCKILLTYAEIDYSMQTLIVNKNSVVIQK
jgi:hypothetical protein